MTSVGGAVSGAPRRIEITDTRQAAAVCALLTFVGFNLRAVILGVPPVLTLIRHDLGLSYTATGLVTSLPVLIMGGLAWPAGVVAGRLGGRAAVALGLALLAVGAVLRGIWPSAFALLAFTALLSLGIAVAQTAVPVLARQWFPARIGFVSALFSNGLIIGESVAAGLTAPMLGAWFPRDAWPATFVAWSLPVVAALVLWLAFAPASPPTAPRTKRRAPLAEAAPAGQAGTSRPSARRTSVHPLHLGILLGMGSLVFFGMNGWISNYNLANGHEDMTALALSALNTAQLPVSLAMTVFAQRLAGRRWPFIVAGAVVLTAIGGWLTTPAALQPLWASLLGGSSAFVFVLGIALPALLAGPGEVARLSGITLTVSYGAAFVGPLLGGGLWDAFGVPGLAFAPVIAAGALLVILGALLPDRDAFGLVPSATPPDVPIAEADATAAGTARL